MVVSARWCRFGWFGEISSKKVSYRSCFLSLPGS
uniref:Uncharacterized protein n=1 Tax=Rhizophora mucronata TaxID=61149 RepID=A0A2P2Q8Q3_RHIMU